MKFKSILFGFFEWFFLILVTTNSTAQITITQVDFISIGDTIINAYDTIPPVGLSVGGTGSQTWDFTSLQIDYLDTTAYVDPSTTTNGSDFPSSNLSGEAGGFSTYFTSTASSVTFDGIAGDLFGNSNIMSVVYNPPQVAMVFPTTNGTNYQDTTAFDFRFAGSQIGVAVDSISNKHTGYLTSTIDAYGTIITPAGTFPVLRQYTMEILIDTIFIQSAIFTGGQWVMPDSATLGFPNPTIDTTYNYSWLANGENYPVVEMETDAPGGNVISANFKIGTSLVANMISTTVISCTGNCDAQAVIEGFNGTAPYTYLWSPGGDTTDTISGLCPGTYQVTVIDALNDTAVASVVFTEPAVLSDSLSVTNVNCKGNANGIIAAGVTGGTTPYSYNWSSGGTGASELGLGPGNYTVVITDANNCSLTDSTTVSEPASILVVNVTTTMVSCDTCSDGIAIAAVSGGNSPYSYSWNDPASQATATATGLNPGTYIVSVTDSNGCVVAASDNVNATGILEMNLISSILTIYPNPSKGWIIVESNYEADFIQVVNMMGELVCKEKMHGSRSEIDISKLSEGIYLIRVVGDKFTATKKIHKIN